MQKPSRMKRIKLQIIFFLLFMLYGCASPYIRTAWKAQHAFSGKYNKILVAGIIKDEDLTLRRQVETHFTEDLRESGYNAVSALEEYGSKGLANLGEEETYIQLRSSGTDAVITIALIDKTKEKYHKPRKAYGYVSHYYYNRIWNYQTIQGELADGYYPANAKFFWETILFDLNTLEPQCTVQKKSFKAGDAEIIGHENGKQIIRRMLKEKILKKKMKEG